jgi:hypothetical protein
VSIAIYKITNSVGRNCTGSTSFFLRAEETPVDARGLAVPGMPVGSPGMEMGERVDSYDVLLLKNDGTSEVYAHIDGSE